MIIPFRPRAPKQQSEESKKRLAETIYVQATKIDDRTPKEGIRLYRRALELNPAHDKAMSNIGRLYYLQQQFGAAENWWLRSLHANPWQTEANNNIGYLRATRNEFASAIEFFRAALKVDETFSNAHFYLADTLQKLGRVQEARVHWRRYVQLGGECRDEALAAIDWCVIK